MKDLQERIMQFDKERGWDRIKDPKEYLLALVEEIGEMRNFYKWEKNQETIDKITKENYEEVEDNIGDMLFITLKLAGYLGIDSETALRKVIENNEKRFPVEKVIGKTGNTYVHGKEVDKQYSEE